MSGEAWAALAAVLWSSSVIMLRISGLSIPALPLTLFKSVVASLCFVVTLLVLGEPLVMGLSAEQHVRLVLSAVLGISIADTLFVAALNRLGASLQALADCIYAPTLAAVGFVMFGEGMNSAEILGGCLVVLGVAVGISRADRFIPARDLYSGIVLAASAHVIMGFGILMVRDIFREVSVVWVSGYRFLVASLVLAAFAAWRGSEANIALPFRRRDLWKWMVPLSVLGPFLATICWVAGFKYTTPGRAAIYNQLSTVFIIIQARIFLKEPLTPRRMAGLALAIAGAIVVGSH